MNKEIFFSSLKTMPYHVKKKIIDLDFDENFYGDR